MIGRNVDIAAVVVLLAGVGLFVHVRDALQKAEIMQEMIIFSKPPTGPMPEFPLPPILWHSD